jgi:hypothetical protein
MRLLINANVFGWRMTGLMPKGAKWFFGFSRQPKEIAGEPRLVSYAPDGSTCTLNFDGDEHYYDRTGTTANASVSGARSASDSTRKLERKD